jgi:hypothetical protein
MMQRPWRKRGGLWSFLLLQYWAARAGKPDDFAGFLDDLPFFTN